MTDNSSSPRSGPRKAYGNIRYRVNFGIRHLKSAVSAAIRVRQIENENPDPQFGIFFEELASNCVSCLWFSTAAVESYLNEILLTPDHCFPETNINAIEVIRESIDRKEAIDKISYVIKLKGDLGPNRGQEPWQSFITLIKIRNALVHYRPEWSNELEEHKKLIERIKSKVPKSKYFSEYGDEFPNSHCSFLFCKWVLETTLKVISEIESYVGYITTWDEFQKTLLDKLNSDASKT